MINSIFKHYEWLIASVWALLALTVYMQFISTCPFGESVLFTFSTLAITYIITTYISKYLLPIVLKSKNIRLFAFQFVSLTILLAFLLALDAKIFVWLEETGIYEHSPLFMGMGRPFYLEFLGNILSAFVANLAFCAIRFFEEYYKMLQEHAKLQQAHLEDQLRLLRDQINPHLMFNILNHIHILMKKNVDMADQLLLNYSDVLRYQLYESNKEYVSLEKEVDYLKDVVEVEKTRWGNELQVDCTWNIENGKMGIKPLLLIPFIENAFKHVSRLPSQTGYVHITLTQQANQLRLEVENSRTDHAPQRKNASGLGLENVKKRLELLYSDRHELIIHKTATVYKTTLIITL